MYGCLANRSKSPLDITSLCNVKRPAFLNIAGIVCKPFQKARLTSVNTHYLSVSIQGIKVKGGDASLSYVPCTWPNICPWLDICTQHSALNKHADLQILIVTEDSQTNS